MSTSAAWPPFCDSIGTPVVILTRARSGSTVTCAKLAAASNSSAELLCGASRFFGFDPAKQSSTDLIATARSYLCNFPAVVHALVGFKWKAYWPQNPRFVPLWRWLATHRVQVVFLRRNILDVALHELKHESVPGYDDCQSRRHEASCAQLRRSATMHASVPKVLELLNRYAAEDDTIRNDRKPSTQTSFRSSTKNRSSASTTNAWP